MRLRESVKRGYEGEQIIPMQAMKKKVIQQKFR